MWGGAPCPEEQESAKISDSEKMELRHFGNGLFNWIAMDLLEDSRRNFPLPNVSAKSALVIYVILRGAYPCSASVPVQFPRNQFDRVIRTEQRVSSGEKAW